MFRLFISFVSFRRLFFLSWSLLTHLALPDLLFVHSIRLNCAPVNSQWRWDFDTKIPSRWFEKKTVRLWLDTPVTITDVNSIHQNPSTISKRQVTKRSSLKSRAPLSVPANQLKSASYETSFVAITFRAFSKLCYQICFETVRIHQPKKPIGVVLTLKLWQQLFLADGALKPLRCGSGPCRFPSLLNMFPRYKLQLYLFCLCFRCTFNLVGVHSLWSIFNHFLFSFSLFSFLARPCCPPNSSPFFPIPRRTRSDLIEKRAQARRNGRS